MRRHSTTRLRTRPEPNHDRMHKHPRRSAGARIHPVTCDWLSRLRLREPAPGGLRPDLSAPPTTCQHPGPETLGHDQCRQRATSVRWRFDGSSDRRHANSFRRIDVSACRRRRHSSEQNRRRRPRPPVGPGHQTRSTFVAARGSRERERAREGTTVGPSGCLDESQAPLVATHVEWRRRATHREIWAAWPTPPLTIQTPSMSDRRREGPTFDSSPPRSGWSGAPTYVRSITTVTTRRGTAARPRLRAPARRRPSQARAPRTDGGPEPYL
jgi:hypothetical protein